MTKPIISVIVPFYNSEKFVAPLIENFKAQTFKDFELLLVNDGSTDGTLEEMKKLLSQDLDFKIKILNKTNGGVSSARNAGTKNAEGDWLCFCDCDDVISKDYLYVLYKTATEKNYDMALCRITRNEQELFEGKKADVECFSKTDFLKEFLYNGINYAHCGGIFSKKYFDSGFKYPEGYKFSEDVYLLWQIIASTGKIPVIKNPLYYYYQNADSAMNRKMTLDRMGAVELMRKLEPIIQKQAPDFYPEFKKYAASRHVWSVLWQAAGSFKKFAEFSEYAENFSPKEELPKLFDYPSKKVAYTSKLYCLSPKIYFFLMKIYVKLFK